MCDGLISTCFLVLFFSMYIVFTCDTPSFCESRGSPAHCFHRNSTRMRKKLTSTCQFSAITLLTSHSCGLLLLSSLSLTLQSSERAHFIAFVCVYKCVCACACVRHCVCVYMLACMHVPVCIRVCLHVSETRHDLVSGEGLGSPGPAHSRPDSAAELINISLQSKVGSAMRPRGCTN